MNYKELYIIVKANNKFNKSLFEYLNSNQKKINNNNFILKPILINNKVIDKYTKMGVVKIPSLLHNGIIVGGNNQIIEYIENLCKKKVNNKNIDENEIDMKNYMLQEVMNNENENIEAPISSDELHNNRFDNRSNGKNNIVQKKGNVINYNDDDDYVDNEEDKLLLQHLNNNSDINL